MDAPARTGRVRLHAAGSERLTNLLGVLADAGRNWSRDEAVLTSGVVTVDEHSATFEDTPAHQGHTVGAPPPRWRWLQCNGFADDSVAVETLNLDGTHSVCLRQGGEAYPLNRLSHVLRGNETLHADVGDDRGEWRIRARGEGVELTVTVGADPTHWQPMAYCTPDESLRYNAHCSVPDVTLTYRLGREGPGTLESGAGRAEWVGSVPHVSAEYRPAWD